jgi:hypothetical protein
LTDGVNDFESRLGDSKRARTGNTVEAASGKQAKFKQVRLEGFMKMPPDIFYEVSIAKRVIMFADLAILAQIDCISFGAWRSDFSCAIEQALSWTANEAFCSLHVVSGRAKSRRTSTLSSGAVHAAVCGPLILQVLFGSHDFEFACIHRWT